MNNKQGSPELIIEKAKALINHNHTGSSLSDLVWDMRLDDLRSSIKEYDKIYGSKWYDGFCFWRYL